MIRSFLLDDSGATAIEYGLIAALVSIAAIGALTSIGNSLGALYNATGNAMSNAVGG